MEPRPLTVLLVSEDRALLRRLWRFLTVLGYEVWPVADPSQAAAAWEACAADFAIVDGAGLGEVVDLVGASADRGPAGAGCYTLLLTSSQAAGDLGAALEAGVDDFLAKPVVYGELLSRLRAGARRLEFDRRLRAQIGVEPVTGLAGRNAFEAQLRAELSAARADDRETACILIEIDFLDRVKRTHGEPGRDAVLLAVAGHLRARCGELGMLASFGDGAFAVLAGGLSEVEAAARAEHVRLALADAEFACGERALRLTCSAGVAAAGGDAPAQTAEDVLRQAEEALQVAQSSGRNCVVRFADLEEDARICAEFAVPGKVFERTVARDIMTPCPCTLRAGESAGRAAEWLRRTQLDAIAVVDDRGRLVGLATDQGELADGEDAAVKIGDVMLKDVPTYAEDASLAALGEFFRRDARTHVVIARDRRPLGIVTADTLAALGSKVTSDSFLPAAPFSQTSEYLVVPDLHPAGPDAR